MEIPIIIVLVIAVVALGLGVWALIQQRRQAAAAQQQEQRRQEEAAAAASQLQEQLRNAASHSHPSSKPTVSIMDLEELSMFPAEIKDMWKKNMTRKLIPAAMEKVNKVWGSIPATERKEAANEAEAHANYIIKYFNQKYSQDNPEEEIKKMFYEVLKDFQKQRMRKEARFAAAMTQAPVVKQVVTAMVKATKPPARTVRPL